MTKIENKSIIILRKKKIAVKIHGNEHKMTFLLQNDLKHIYMFNYK